MFGNEDKALRNNTVIITCSHSFLSFEVIKWLFYHLLFRWILCKKQLLTTRLECPFPQRRNKLFLVMSASFALIRMWVSPLSCSLQSVKLEVWLFFICAYCLAAIPLGGPLTSVCQVFQRFGFNTRNLSNWGANIKKKIKAFCR